MIDYLLHQIKAVFRNLLYENRTKESLQHLEFNKTCIYHD